MILVVLSFFVVRPFLLSIFLGALLAYVSYPLYKRLRKKIPRKTIPALIVCFFVLLILVVPSFFVIKALVKESLALFLLVKQKLATGLFENCANTFCQTLKDFGQDPNVHYQIQEMSKSVTSWVFQRGSDFLLSVPRIMLNGFIIFFTMFYFLKDGRYFVKKVRTILRVGEKKFTFITTRMREVLSGLIYGYFLVALIQGALGALGFFLFGIPSPLFWGLMMALLALIPLLGTGIIWFPASAILFLDGVFQDSSWLMFKGIALFVYSFIFVGGADNILRPKLMGQKAKMHPAIIILGIFGGIFLFGPLGVIVGPLILALTYIFFTAYIE